MMQFSALERFPDWPFAGVRTKPQVAGDTGGVTGFSARTLPSRAPLPLAARRRAVVTLAASAAVLVAAAAARGGDTAGKLEYNRDIRPILSDACFACHGPDSAARKAELRLDERDTAIARGAIVPGAPGESEMIRRIFAADEGDRMPPSETKKTLGEEEKRRLERWVREGAEYQLHWSLIPPRRPELPAVRDTAWARTPIDAFILARLELEGLTPAPEADRRTLARRVGLDLTGLPPRPARVEAFVRDSSPTAYADYVDSLLDLATWGEHRARYWLDYARYADTHGIHFDNFREMWSYRDWVIRAFNANMPFDRFTVENLAGDLLPERTLDQQIASGFNRCNMTTNEGGIIDEEYLVHYTRDRTETTAQVWLGLTAGCAVCHNHKFDPLSQREFYELAAFFNNTTQGARDGNIKDTPPIVAVPAAADRARWEALPVEIAAAAKRVEERRESARADFLAWRASASAEELASALPVDGLHLRARLDEGQGKSVRIAAADGEREVPLSDSAGWRQGRAGMALAVEGVACEIADVGDFAREEAFTCAAWVNVPKDAGFGAICARMDSANRYRGWDLWSQGGRIGMHLVGSWPESGLKAFAKNRVEADRWVHVAVSYDGSSSAAGLKVYYDGTPQESVVENDRLAGEIRTEVPFRIGQRSGGEAFRGGLADLRIYRRALAPGEVASLARLSSFAEILAKGEEAQSAEEKAALYAFWLEAFDEPYRELAAARDRLEREREEIGARGTIAHVMQERTDPAMAYVLFRGEYDERRDAVSADTPDVFPPFPAGLSRDRLGFARWLLLPEHPLTARVTVNRFWQEVFGTGIVKTAGDFGVSGELPSHPELLDWLAVEFRESGWDVKKLFKMIVLSSAYRQSAVATPEKLEKDPENRLLTRGPRFRMDAEMVRDYALAASGLLVETIGGPSVKPYQPPGVWEAIAMNVSNTRSYERGTGDDLYRRSLYTFVKRMAPPASMEIFNAPNREICAVRRERTNTPLQALVTLNDEQFVEAARHLAGRALHEGEGQFEKSLRVLTSRLLARALTAEETRVVRESLAELVAYYRDHGEDARRLITVGESPPDETLEAGTLAAWTMLANQLMNLDEVLNK